MRSIRRLNSAWKRHRPLRFVYLIFYNLWYGFMQLIGHRRDDSAGGLGFDAKYGVDTGRWMEVGEMNVDPQAAKYAHRYQTTSIEQINHVLGMLHVEHSQFSFIDFGSGKGRVLLLASAFAFNAIIGVEFSDELHRICITNIERYRGERQKCRNLTSVCCDAGAFTLPDGPLVCYFYNPFERPLLAQVVANMEAKAARDGDKIYAIYVDPKMADVFSAERWDIEHNDGAYMIFRSRDCA